MFKKISLFLIAIISVIALVGCFDLKEVDSIEFVNFPQATYYQVNPKDVAKLNQAYETLLGEITIRITKNGTEKNIVTLKEAIEAGDVTVNFDASILTTTGTKTMVITLGSAKLTYVFNVVEGKLFESGTGLENDPYIIKTVEQFMNIGTRVFGVPVPTTTASEEAEEAWKYYYKFSFPYLAGGKHYKLANDLDFTGIDYRTLGSFGGLNYIPFTGTIDGNNKSISNLSIQGYSDVSSLFAGANGATFENITFKNLLINTDSKYACALFGLAGYNMNPNDEDDTKEHINYVKNVDVESGYIAGQRVAGLCGEISNTVFVNCDIKEDVTLYGFAGTWNGGLYLTSNNRKYSYKMIGYGATYTAATLLGLDELNTALGKTESTYIGYNQEAAKEDITLDGENEYNAIVYNCTIDATLFATGTQSGLYTISAINHVYGTAAKAAYSTLFISGESKAKNYEYTDFWKASKQLDAEEYATVQQSIWCYLVNGTYEWPSIKVVGLTVDHGVIDLDNIDGNGTKYYHYQYDIDGNQIGEPFEPTFPLEWSSSLNGIALDYTYFDDEGNVVGVYRVLLDKDLYSFDFSEDRRKVEYTKLS